MLVLWRGERGSFGSFGDGASQFLHCTDAEMLSDDEVVELDLSLGILDLEEGTCVSHIDESLRQPQLYLSGELEQANVVSDGDALLADTLCDFALREAVLLGELLVSQCYLDGVEVFALDILYECQLQQFTGLRSTDIGW